MRPPFIRGLVLGLSGGLSRPASTNGHGPRRALTAEVILGTHPSLEGGDKVGKCRPLKGSRPVCILCLTLLRRMHLLCLIKVLVCYVLFVV